MDLPGLDGTRLYRQAIIGQRHRTHRHRADLQHADRASHEDLTYDDILREIEHWQAEQASTTTIHAGVLEHYRWCGDASPDRQPRGVSLLCAGHPQRQAEPDVHALRRHQRHHAPA
ncbi:MAG: hypothetical protein U0166_08295 [Acidobacteriota bacterium]